jgi:hypothetical protein
MPVEKVYDVLAEEKIQRPIERHAELLFASRELAEVNASPKKPCKETGKVSAEKDWLCQFGGRSQRGAPEWKMKTSFSVRNEWPR